MDELERQAAEVIRRQRPPSIDRIVSRAYQLRRRRRVTLAGFGSLVVVLIAGIVIAQSQGDEGGQEQRTVNSVVSTSTVVPASPTTTAESTATTSPVPTTIMAIPTLPPLPDEGLAIDTDSGVAFVDLDGQTLAELSGFSLTINWRPDHGVRIVDATGRVLALDSSVGQLIESTEPPPELPDHWLTLRPPPATAEATVVAGHWRWALPLAGKGVELAQWSGECEVPRALMVNEDGNVRSPFGGDWTNAPSSFALGWTADGRALVLVPSANPGCGVGIEAGVYLIGFDADGFEHLVTTSAAHLITTSAAQFWSTAAPQSSDWPPESSPPEVEQQSLGSGQLVTAPKGWRSSGEQLGGGSSSSTTFVSPFDERFRWVVSIEACVSCMSQSGDVVQPLVPDDALQFPIWSGDRVWTYQRPNSDDGWRTDGVWIAVLNPDGSPNGFATGEISYFTGGVQLRNRLVEDLVAAFR